MISLLQRWRARQLNFYNEEKGVFCNFDETQEVKSNEIRNMLTI